jgi:hypothetical protein
MKETKWSPNPSSYFVSLCISGPRCPNSFHLYSGMETFMESTTEIAVWQHQGIPTQVKGPNFHLSIVSSELTPPQPCGHVCEVRNTDCSLFSWKMHPPLLRLIAPAPAPGPDSSYVIISTGTPRTALPPVSKYEERAKGRRWNIRSGWKRL